MRALENNKSAVSSASRQFPLVSRPLKLVQSPTADFRSARSLRGSNGGSGFGTNVGRTEGNGEFLERLIVLPGARRPDARREAGGGHQRRGEEPGDSSRVGRASSRERALVASTRATATRV